MKQYRLDKSLFRTIMTAMAICLISFQATAYDFSYLYQGKRLYYNITSDSTVAVTHEGISELDYVSGEVVIPSSLQRGDSTYMVTSVEEFAFYACSGLSSVVMPNSVVSIGTCAFQESGIMSVVIPESVTSIGERAFENCAALTSVIIPNAIDTIANGTFGGCTGLISATIGTGVTFIGSEAFENCSRLITVNIPDSVVVIKYGAFMGCSGLTSVTIGSGVTSIEGAVFEDCSRLASVTIPAGVTIIAPRLFSGCSKLTSVVLPTGLNAIGANAFFYCSRLASISIPDSVEMIVNNAFSGCSSLTEITIPEGVTFIGTGAFSGCENLTTLNFNAVNCSDFSSWNHSPFSNTALTTVNIGENVQHIPANFLRDNDSLTSLSIPESVTSIGGSAFSGCSGLTSVNIPGGVTFVNDSTFYNCSSLTSVELSEGIVSVENGAFYGCSGLTTLTIPSTVNFIGNGTEGLAAFGGCTGLSSIIVKAYYPPVLSNENTFPFAEIRNIPVYVPCGTQGDYASDNKWGHFLNIMDTMLYSLDLSVNDTAFGEVTYSCGQFGTELTAVQGVCGRFIGWNDGNTENPRVVSVMSDTAFVAVFESMGYSESIIAEICEGETYSDNGFEESEAGTYTQRRQTIGGCDSVITLCLTVNPIFDTIINASINEGEVYMDNGFNVSEAGTYTQTLQAANGCDSVVTLNLTVNLSLNDALTEEFDFSVYPNPAKDYAILSVGGLKDEVKVYLSDIQGRRLKEYALKAGQESLRIDLGTLPTGVYTISIRNTTMRLIVD